MRRGKRKAFIFTAVCSLLLEEAVIQRNVEASPAHGSFADHERTDESVASL